MMASVMEMERSYYSSEIAEAIGVKPVTIRAWASQFEKRGHTFLRDQKGHRAFVDTDITMFRRYQELVKAKGINQDSAFDIVISRHSSLEQNTSIALPTMETQGLIASFEERFEKLSSKLDDLQRENAELYQRLNDDLRRRDEQMTQFITAIRESATTKKRPRWSMFFTRRN